MGSANTPRINKRQIFVHRVRALPPLGGWKVSGALCAVPGAVRVSGQAALGAGFTVHLTTVQRHLGDTQSRAKVQLLLWEQKIKPGCKIFQILASMVAVK